MIRIWRGFGNEWSYHGSMTYIQNLKHKALVKDGLSPVLAREFIFYDFFHAYMRRFRAGIRRGIAGDTKSSTWKWFRKCYEDAVRKARRGIRGGYKPPKRDYIPSQPHRKLLPDGTIDYEHTREYERGRRAKQRREKTQLPKDVISIQYDSEGKIIGGVKFDKETGRYIEWKP